MSDQEAWWLNTQIHDFERESEESTSQGEDLRSSCQCMYSIHVSGVTSSVYHRVYLWKDLTNCRVSQKHPRFSDQMISSTGSWFPDKAMSTHIEFYKIGVRLFCDDFSSSSALENVESWWTLWITVLYLMTYTWRLGHWSDRDDICMTDLSCMRSVSLQGCLLFSLPSTSNKFGNLSLRQESLLRDFLDKK